MSMHTDEQMYREQLQRTVQYQKILSRIIAKIRASIDTESLCSTSSQEICWVLNVDRVAFYRFNPDWSGEFINSLGFAQVPWDKLTAFGKNLVWEDSHLQQTQGGRYRQNEPFGVGDVYAAGHSRCHLEILEQFQIRAYAIAPIFTGTKLWGLMAAYQHSGPRAWYSDEVEFLLQVSTYIGVAMQVANQQAESLAQLKQQTADLQDAVARQRALTEVVNNIRSSLDTESIFQTACREVCKLLKLERAAIYRFNPDWSGEFISHSGMMDSQWGNNNSFGKKLVWQHTYKTPEAVAIAIMKPLLLLIFIRWVIPAVTWIFWHNLRFAPIL
jgi:GAF domain-containing protein